MALPVFQRVKKVLTGFFARFKNAMFFVKLHFTKNLAVLVKKSDKSDVFDGCLSNSRRAAAPSSSPSVASDYAFIFSSLKSEETPQPELRCFLFGIKIVSGASGGGTGYGRGWRKEYVLK